MKRRNTYRLPPPPPVSFSLSAYTEIADDHDHDDHNHDNDNDNGNGDDQEFLLNSDVEHVRVYYANQYAKLRELMRTFAAQVGDLEVLATASSSSSSSNDNTFDNNDNNDDASFSVNSSMDTSMTNSTNTTTTNKEKIRSLRRMLRFRPKPNNKMQQGSSPKSVMDLQIGRNNRNNTTARRRRSDTNTNANANANTEEQQQQQQHPEHALSSALTHLKHAMEGSEEHRQFILTQLTATHQEKATLVLEANSTKQELEACIARLEQERDQLDEQNAVQEETMEHLNQVLQDLKETDATTKGDKERLTGQLKSLHDEIAALQHQQDEQQARRKTEDKEIVSTMHMMQDYIHNLEEEKSQVEMECESHEATIAQMGTDQAQKLHALDAAILQEQEHLGVVVVEATQVKAQLDELQATHAQLLDTCTVQEEQLASVHKDHSELLTTRTQEFEEERERLETKFQSQHDAAALMQDQETNSLARIQGLQAERDQLLVKIKSQEEDAIVMGRRVSELGSSAEASNTTVAVQETVAKLEKATHEGQLLTSKCATQERQLTKLEKDLKSQHDAAALRQDQETKSVARIQGLQAEREQLLVKLKSKEDAIVMVRRVSELGNVESNVAVQETAAKLEKATNEGQLLTSKCATQERQLTKLEKDLKRKESIQAELMKGVDATVRNLKDRIDSLEEEVDRSHRLCHSQENTISSLSATVANTIEQEEEEKKDEDKSSALKDATARIKELEFEREHLKSKSIAQECLIGELLQDDYTEEDEYNEYTTNKEEDGEQKKDKVSEVSDWISELQDEVDRSKSVEGLKTRIKSLEAERDELHTKCSSQEDTIDRLENQHYALKADRDQLNITCSSQEDAIDTLEHMAKALEADRDQLNITCSSQEEVIDSLEHKINGVVDETLASDKKGEENEYTSLEKKKEIEHTLAIDTLENMAKALEADRDQLNITCSSQEEVIASLESMANGLVDENLVMPKKGEENEYTSEEKKEEKEHTSEEMTETASKDLKARIKARFEALKTERDDFHSKCKTQEETIARLEKQVNGFIDVKLDVDKKGDANEYNDYGSTSEEMKESLESLEQMKQRLATKACTREAAIAFLEDQNELKDARLAILEGMVKSMMSERSASSRASTTAANTAARATVTAAQASVAATRWKKKLFSAMSQENTDTSTADQAKAQVNSSDEQSAFGVEPWVYPCLQLSTSQDRLFE
jgi:hypothetical protein